MSCLCLFFNRLLKTLLIINFIHKFPSLSFLFSYTIIMIPRSKASKAVYACAKDIELETDLIIILNFVRKRKEFFHIWKQNLFFSALERQMLAQMQVAQPLPLLLVIAPTELTLDQALSVRLPKLILTGLMHFVLTFYALHFVPICTLITLPDIQILFLPHGFLNAIHHLRFLVLKAYSI